MNNEITVSPNDKEVQIIESAAKKTKRLEGDEVVIEIRVPAYIYTERKYWSVNYSIGGTEIH